MFNLGPLVPRSEAVPEVLNLIVAVAAASAVGQRARGCKGREGGPCLSGRPECSEERFSERVFLQREPQTQSICNLELMAPKLRENAGVKKERHAHRRTALGPGEQGANQCLGGMSGEKHLLHCISLASPDSIHVQRGTATGTAVNFRAHLSRLRMEQASWSELWLRV